MTLPHASGAISQHSSSKLSPRLGPRVAEVNALPMVTQRFAW
jgi:hypothetical protein